MFFSFNEKLASYVGDYFINHEIRIDRHEATRISMECHGFSSASFLVQNFPQGLVTRHRAQKGMLKGWRL